MPPGTSGVPPSVHSVPILAAEPASEIPGPDHLASPGKGASGKATLVVHLSGTGGTPASARPYLEAFISAGLPVISLAYPNARSLGSLCGNDLEAYGLAREEICFGTDASSLVTVGPADSITRRLEKTLSYLAQNYPQEGWEDFLFQGSVRWEKILVSGFSQGAGHALYLARTLSLKGVIMLGGPVDGRISEPRDSAVWLKSSLWETPQNRWKIFINTFDFYWESQRTNLVTLGLDPEGAPQVPGNSVPYGGTLFLASWDQGDDSHASVSEAGATPLDSQGNPVFRGLWNYLASWASN